MSMGGHLNLDGGTLNLGGETQPPRRLPYNLSANLTACQRGRFLETRVCVWKSVCIYEIRREKTWMIIMRGNLQKASFQEAEFFD